MWRSRIKPSPSSLGVIPNTLWKKARHFHIAGSTDTRSGVVGAVYLHRDTPCLSASIQARQMKQMTIQQYDDVSDMPEAGGILDCA